MSALHLHRHCPDSRRTFTKRLMLEKHIQLMHGIKDPDVKEMTESTNIEESEVKEDTKVNALVVPLSVVIVLVSSCLDEVRLFYRYIDFMARWDPDDYSLTSGITLAKAFHSVIPASGQYLVCELRHVY